MYLGLFVFKKSNKFNMNVCMCREEASVWRRGGDEPSSWRDSRREDSDRGERRDLGGRRDDRDRERDVRAPQRDQDEG